jgi:hypothetical protein
MWKRERAKKFIMGRSNKFTSALYSHWFSQEEQDLKYKLYHLMKLGGSLDKVPQKMKNFL